MFCKHCGKELSEEAFMCPNCGTPTRTDLNKDNTQKELANSEVESAPAGVNKVGLATLAFVLSMIAFVTGIIFGALGYVFFSLVFIESLSILPALAGIAIGVYLLSTERNRLTGNAKAFTVVSIVLSAVVLLFLFLTICIIIGAVS